jgi:hypothetical protein
MTWADMISMTIAAAAGVECVVGRLAQLDWRRHRASEMALYLAGAVVCILSASLTWQGAGVLALDGLAMAAAAYLLMTWGDWRHGPPLEVWRGTGPTRADVMPSRIDDGGR